MNNQLGIRLPSDINLKSDEKTALEEYQVRFLYAAATLPHSVVEGFLDLLETASESETNPVFERIGCKELQ